MRRRTPREIQGLSCTTVTVPHRACSSVADKFYAEKGFINMCGNNNWLWIIIILIVLFAGGNYGFGCGCGCNNCCENNCGCNNGCC